LSTGTAKARKRLSRGERREVIERAAMEVFAERGYFGASMDEIAKRSGVTPPVVYDHFASKIELHKRLLERTREELLEMWRTNLAGDEPASVRIPRALAAWARYVEEHPYTARMFFFETTGDPEVAAVHREIQQEARAALAAILATEAGAAELTRSLDQQELEMSAEVLRAGLAGLAIWWQDHPEVPRERIVETAVNAVWIGLERAGAGETWSGGATGR
jgi:AcrR family transcriptional regulator